MGFVRVDIGADTAVMKASGQSLHSINMYCEPTTCHMLIYIHWGERGCGDEFLGARVSGGSWVDSALRQPLRVRARTLLLAEQFDRDRGFR